MTRNPCGADGPPGHTRGFDGAFYAHHIPHLRKRLLRMGFVGADMDDLVQHTFVIAQDHWSECPRGRTRQRNWLEGIAWRQGMNWRRHKQRRGEIVDEESLDSFIGDELDIEGLIDARRAFTAAFAELLTRDRDMLLEYYVDGLSLTEIAIRYGIPRSTAWSRLQKLRRDAVERTLRLRFDDERKLTA